MPNPSRAKVEIEPLLSGFGAIVHGGDTLWVDTAKAYETLFPLMQEISHRVEVFHATNEGNRQIFLRKWGQEIIDTTKERYGMGVDPSPCPSAPGHGPSQPIPRGLLHAAHRGHERG